MHSATKFIGGHGDVLAGVVAGSEAWAARLRRVRILTGGVLHPQGAYLLHRGLATLPLRVRQSEATATALAARLAAHEGVGTVYHPSLGRDRGLVGEGRQMSGPGPMLSFEVLGPDGEADGPGAYAAAEVFLGALRLATPAVSLGSTDTLAQHPAGLTQRVVSDSTRAGGGVTAGLVRLSVGLEAPRAISGTTSTGPSGRDGPPPRHAGAPPSAGKRAWRGPGAPAEAGCALPQPSRRPVWAR